MSTVCVSCGCAKSIDDFVKSNRTKSGYTRRCKACHAEISKRSRDANQESRRNSVKKYYETHKEEHKRSVANWTKNNPEKVKAIVANYRVKNVEKIKEYRKQFGAALTRKSRNKFPVRYKARNKVNNSVAKGLIPSVKTLRCYDCGNHATDYHHHLGYEPQHWLDVIPLCRKCHAIHK